MRLLVLMSLMLAIAPGALVAEARHGTSMEYRVGNDVLVAQIWAVSDHIVVSRTASEVAKGGFPKSAARAVGLAFMQDHGMSNCALTGVVPHFDNIPGIYKVTYRC